MIDVKFVETDERPVAVRGRSANELTEDEQGVLDAFRVSIKKGSDATGEWLGKPMKTQIADTEGFKDLRRMVQKAANIEQLGSRVRLTEEDGKLFVTFWAVQLTEREYVTCPVCSKNVAVTDDDKVRVHGPQANRCEGSGANVTR